MSALKIGDKAPEFELPADGGTTIKLSDYKGRKVILYFYPKDDTPGCTKEACGFRDHEADFSNLDAQVIGVSKDSVKKHDKFKEKYDLNFPLIADEETELCEKYGVWVEKSMYGKKYMGIQRATFLIDESGKIAKIWPNVKVKGHVEEVVAEIQNLSKAA